MITLLLINLLAVPLILAIICYNRLVRDKNRVEAAWSDINVQLARRHALIPKLVELVKSYGDYERQTLEQLTHLRSTNQHNYQPDQKLDLENQLSKNLERVLAVIEHYPDIKASEQFLNLQHQFSELENTIQAARRFYNGAVKNLNIRIDSFPDLIIARLFKFKPAEFFELHSIPSLS